MVEYALVSLPDSVEARSIEMKVKKSTAPKAETVAVKATKTKKTAAKAKKPALATVQFTFRAEPGKKVFLSGDFLNWDPAGKALADKKNEGIYTVSVKLAPGRYEYKFVVDGVWVADPECADFVQNDQGTLNSVITVK